MVIKSIVYIKQNTCTFLKNMVKYTMVVHYSSYTVYYEGGAKNPLKGTSLKFLVDARNASFVCFQEVRL